MKKVLLTMLGALALLSGAKAQTPGSDLPNLKQLFELTDSIDVNLRANFSPLIGLSASISNNGYSQVSATYINAIVKAGGTPVIIPAVTDGQVLRNTLANLDGLVLVGGADVNPMWYGEQPIQQLGGVDPAAKAPRRSLGAADSRQCAWCSRAEVPCRAAAHEPASHCCGWRREGC